MMSQEQSLFAHLRNSEICGFNFAGKDAGARAGGVEWRVREGESPSLVRLLASDAGHSETESIEHLTK